MARAFRKKLRRAFIDIDSSSKERDIICNYEQKQTADSYASIKATEALHSAAAVYGKTRKDQIRRTDKGGGEPRWAI
jgi:hypothetical protein